MDDRLRVVDLLPLKLAKDVSQQLHVISEYIELTEGEAVKIVKVFVFNGMINGVMSSQDYSYVSEELAKEYYLEQSLPKELTDGV